MSAKVSKNVVFAACDSRYLIDHGQTFIKSALDTGHNIHIHLINPSDRADEILKKAHNKGKLSYSLEWAKNVDRTYYACSRFLMLPDLMYVDQSKGIERNYLVVDIDAFFLKPFPFPEDKEIGVMLREPLHDGKGWEGRGSRVAAGITYFSHESRDFAIRIKERIRELGTTKWFTDQVALYEAYEEMYAHCPEKVEFFQLEHHDWEFHEDSYMWSGKGPRKTNNKTYTDMKSVIGK